MSRLAAETQAINLGQGFPDFPIDPELIDLVEQGMRKGYNQYAPMAGLPILRERLCDKARSLYAHEYDPDKEITVTAGATQAIFTAIQGVVHPGDEVIILDPAYDCYAPAVKLAGGIPVHVNLAPDLCVDVPGIANAITERTRLLMINTPHNPGGRVIKEQDILAIADLLTETEVIILSDEVYEHLIYDDEPHASVIRFPELRERAFVVFSFGKVFHATGWKMGYAFAPEWLMTEFRKVHQFNVFSVNSAMQYGLAEYLLNPQKYLGLPEFFGKKRDYFIKGLSESRFRPLPCEGSYFVTADYAAISDLPDREFASWFTKEHGVATIPLSPFYEDPPAGQRLIRFCFGKTDDVIDQALEKLIKV